MTNLMKDMTKREMYVLVLVSGMLQDADASWLEKYGDNVIKAAELMADKMLFRDKIEFHPTPFEAEYIGGDSVPDTVDLSGRGLGDLEYGDVEVVGNTLDDLGYYKTTEVVGIVETVTEEVSEEDLDADGRRC